MIIVDITAGFKKVLEFVWLLITTIWNDQFEKGYQQNDVVKIENLLGIFLEKNSLIGELLTISISNFDEYQFLINHDFEITLEYFQCESNLILWSSFDLPISERLI